MVQDRPPEGAPVNPGKEEPQVFAPGYAPEELVEIAQKLVRHRLAR